MAGVYNMMLCNLWYGMNSEWVLNCTSAFVPEASWPDWTVQAFACGRYAVGVLYFQNSRIPFNKSAWGAPDFGVQPISAAPHSTHNDVYDVSPSTMSHM